MGPVRSKEAALLLTQPFVQRAQSALASGEGVCLGASLRGRHSVCMLVLQVSCFSAAGSGIGVKGSGHQILGGAAGRCCDAGRSVAAALRALHPVQTPGAGQACVGSLSTLVIRGRTC